MRTCTKCEAPVWTGYVIADGLEYYCSDSCLHKKYTPAAYQEMYKQDEAYWSEWETQSCDECSEEFSNLRYYKNNEYLCQSCFDRKHNEPHFVTYVHWDLSLGTQFETKVFPNKRQAERYAGMKIEGLSNSLSLNETHINLDNSHLKYSNVTGTETFEVYVDKVEIINLPVKETAPKGGESS